MNNFDEKFSLNQSLSEEKIEYYEDTHDEEGSYLERLKEFTAQRNGATFVGREDTFNPRPNNIVSDQVEEKKEEKIEIQPQVEEVKDKEVDFKDVIEFEPKIEKDAEKIIKNIKNSDPVIIKIADCDVDVAQRVLDFVAGAVFALDGTMKRLSSGMFLALPPKVKVIIEEEVTNE